MQVRDHNPHKRRLHLPIVGTNGVPVSEGRKPSWLKVRLGTGPNYRDVQDIVRQQRVHTVCEEAMCPNIGECWEEREATFLILGVGARGVAADVMTARPDPVDEDERSRGGGRPRHGAAASCSLASH
jgi:lipoic acid synthetase